MVLKRRHWIIVVLPLVLLMLLTACERPLASNDSETAEQAAEATAVAESQEAESANEDSAAGSAEEGDDGAAEPEQEAAEETDAEAADGPVQDADAEAGDEAAQDADAEDAEAETDSDVSEEAESSDPEVGGGTPDMAADEEAAAEEDADEATSGEESTDEAEADESATAETDQETEEMADSEETEAASESDADSEAAAAEGEESEESATEESASEDEAMTAEQETATQTTLPTTHTVAPGENLYRIGLKYGMSWVTLAAYNHLPNANYIRVGQVLQIPGGTSPSPTPPPTPPDESGYTNYVVQRGDTLNSIGRKFGVSWVEIAEANGIMNPNLIYAGQILKIPTSQPETPPSVTHTVKGGETLYRISLQYGVHWLAIAQANEIPPPYVIYPGQVLVIPSG